jgi:hypothetical protein
MITAQGNPAKREPPWVVGAKSSAALQGRRPMGVRRADAAGDGATGSLCQGWRAEHGLRPCRAPVPSGILAQGGALPRLPLHARTPLACRMSKLRPPLPCDGRGAGARVRKTRNVILKKRLERGWGSLPKQALRPPKTFVSTHGFVYTGAQSTDVA